MLYIRYGDTVEGTAKGCTLEGNEKTHRNSYHRRCRSSRWYIREGAVVVGGTLEKVPSKVSLKILFTVGLDFTIKY